MITDTGNEYASTVAQRVRTSLGRRVYGLGAIALGLVGLVSGDFADVWQPVPSGTPGRKALAYIAGVFLLAAGAAIQSQQRLAKIGASLLGVLYLIFGLLWLPRVLGYPTIFGTWGGVFEQLSLVAAALVIYGSAGQKEQGRAASRTEQTGRVLFGICAVSFALNHFFAIPQTAAMVPKWILPGPYFWAVATGVAHLLAAIAILSGALAVAGSRALTLMLVLFGVLVWLPRLIAHPRDHMVWSGNAINLAIAGAAWVIADLIASQQAQRNAQDTSQAVGR